MSIACESSLDAEKWLQLIFVFILTDFHTLSDALFFSRREENDYLWPEKKIVSYWLETVNFARFSTVIVYHHDERESLASSRGIIVEQMENVNQHASHVGERFSVCEAEGKIEQVNWISILPFFSLWRAHSLKCQFLDLFAPCRLRVGEWSSKILRLVGSLSTHIIIFSSAHGGRW